MKKKLFLTSGGLPARLRADFLAFIGADPKKLTVAFIPTAADPEEDRQFVADARAELKEIGFSVVNVDLKEHTHDSILKLLRSIDAMYVNGGNTYYLLHWIRKSGFDKAVRVLLAEGKIYIGSSAGSIVTGPDISLAGWEPWEYVHDAKLKDLTGMNFVNFAISPHFQMDSLEKLQKRKRKFPYMVIALTDMQAVQVTDGEYQIVGVGEKVELI